MRKGICSKCNHVINVDEATSNMECPLCHQNILSESAMKTFGRTFTVTKRKAELNMINITNYEEAFKHYKQLLEMEPASLNSLCGEVLSCLYCSNMHKLTIREATNLLLKGSDNITISKENITILSDFLTKVREDAKMITDKFKPFKEESAYTLRMYQTSLSEYIYYLDAYLQIFNGLDKLNVYLKEGKELLNQELENAKKELAEDVKVKNPMQQPHAFKGLDGKEINDIFPNKRKAYKITMGLFASIGVGAILSIVGLILTANKSIDNAVKYSILGVGLTLFIGGYFLRHYLVDKFYKNK